MSENQTPLFADDPEMRSIVLAELAKMRSEMKGNPYAQMALTNATALVHGAPPPHDLDDYVVSGGRRNNWFSRLRRLLTRKKP